MNKNHAIGILLLLIEVFLLATMFSVVPQEVLAGVGSPSTTQLSNLTIANSYPEIYNMTINLDTAIALTPNATTRVQCAAIIVDWNGDTDIDTANATFFDSTVLETSPNDNNDHYTQWPCELNRTFGSFNGVNDDEYKALANCTFDLEYYANPGTWNCTIQVNDSYSGIGIGREQQTVSQLLALGLPDEIQYGTINATSVSEERLANVTNFGNIKVNLTLEGYGHNPNDGNAMNCTLGGNKNITVDLEKFNLTSSVPGTLTFQQFNANYTNLTTTPTAKQFNLTSRISDASDDTTKPTYWRIYVPTGVAGTCTGNIVFGATTAIGS